MDISIYYVNTEAQSNGDHEVHKSDCEFLPNEENRLFLGSFSSCRDAVQEAKRYFPQSNGCATCLSECNIS